MSINNETTSKQNIVSRGRLRSSSRLSEKIPTDKNLNEENKEKEKKKRERKPEKQIAESVKTETIKWLKNMKKKKRVKMRRTNWANGIIKPSRKKNKIEKNKLSLSLSTEINHISVTENFNENTEINTELPEILQSQILDDDEYALFKIDSKQDIYYFLDDRYSFDCKLCNYKGKSIVSHYRTRHPESENLISRLNPEEANKAQIESKMNNFDDITPFDEIENGKNRKTTFVCRFCNTLMTTEISTFVDHLSCHTGEYRYLCELCPFITSYKQNLCIHYYKSHPEIEKSVTYSQIWPSPPNFRIMFGYLCKACNFTQILRKNIQKHINISHLGQNIEIVKISLSKESVNLDDLIATRNIERDLIADKEIEEIYTSSQAETESNNTNKTNEDQQMHKNNKEMDITKLEHIFTDLNKKIEQKLTLNLSELTKTNDQEETINLGAIEVQIQNKKHNYICKVSNCNYTNLDKIKFIEHCANIHANITVLCEICAKENPNNYFTMISLFNHLFDVHINSTNLKILNSAQTEMPEPIIKKDLNPDMGFLQIKDIRTLTEEEEQKLQLTTNLPSIESYKKQPTTGNYVLCKTKKIFNEMLVHPKILDMYKCPIDICSYSCNSQKKFKRHMVSHKCQITVCVYCQMSFKPDKLIVHIKSVHAHCTFQCAFCFYRTISKQYLVYHQKNVHGQNCNTLIKFYQMKPRNKTEFVFDVPPRDVIIFPYTCNQDGCGQQFLIADDFMGHLHIYHKNNLICAICDDPTVYYVNAQNLIQHFVAHNIARFQCQYCICGTNDIEDMFMHYAKNHQHVKPICFVRQKKNGNVSPKTLDDIILINMEEFVILNTEQSTTKQNICISSPTITSTIPEDHNYFTPFVEKSPTAISKTNLENSKITNIDNINIDLDYFTENSEIIPADPLLTDNFEKSDVPKIITDIFENELYKCGAPSCTYSTNFLHDFKMHLHTCNTLNNTYLCGHCNAKFTSIINLCNHIETHGKNKFTCGTCEFKSSLEQVVKHMKDCHKVITTELNPVSLKKDNDKDRFVVEAIEKEIGKENQKSILKMHLGVTSSKEKDKVENVFDFKVIDVDKGLKKNEKMAEEIIDLTTSSHNEQMGDEAKEKTDKENDKIYPDFIPVIKRFICGVLNCNYLTHDDQTFRQHFAEMHANDTVYKCPHCQINILSLEIDKIVCHLKMHDLNLYKCPNCQFFHYQKRNIEEHICENHPNTDKYIVVIRELDDYTNGVSSSEDNIKETSLHQQTEIVLLQQENDSSDSDSEISKEDLNNSSSNLNCRYCDFVAKSTKNLHKHERCHSMNYSYNCNCCNYAQQLKSQNKNKITTETSSSRKRKLIENNLGETPAKILLENKQEYYGCQLCPKRSNDLDEIRSHFFKKHPKNTDHFKYKKIIVEKNKCNYCDWSSDAKSLKQHCLTAHNLQQTKTICAICCQIFHRPCSIKSHFNNMHSTKKISFYTSLEDGIILDKTEYMDEKQLIFMCSYCSDQFDNKTELFNHHYLLHSHLQFKETKKPKNIKSPNPEKKQYKCPNCGRTSNEYDSMKLHLINHFNFGCSHCNKTFSFLYNLKNHHQQHGDLPLIINKTSDYNKQTIDKILATMLFLNKDGTYSTKIDNILDEINDGTHSPENNLKRPHYGTDPDEPPTKILILHELEGTEGNVKKEITTVNNEEYSFYGTKPCDITNYKNVMSEIDIMGKIMRINVVAMSHILNLSPKVRLKDIKNQMKRI